MDKNKPVSGLLSKDNGNRGTPHNSGNAQNSRRSRAHGTETETRNTGTGLRRARGRTEQRTASERTEQCGLCAL